MWNIEPSFKEFSFKEKNNKQSFSQNQILKTMPKSIVFSLVGIPRYD